MGMVECAAVILISGDNKVLYQLRDNKPDIAYPGYLSLIAGKVEKNETPKSAIQRELTEEIIATSKKKVVFSEPLYLFSFITSDEVLEHIHLSSTFVESDELVLLEGQRFIISKNFLWPNDFFMAKHHITAINILIELINKWNQNILKQYGGKKMKIKDYYSMSSLGLKKDYSKMVDTGGFVDLSQGRPTASIIPKNPVNYIALLEFKKDVPRGNHYHFKKIEYMVVLQGKLECELKLKNNPELGSEFITLETGQVICIMPDCIHTYKAIDNDVIALEYSPQDYEDKDTVSL